MTADRLHELLKRAKGAVAQSLASAPVALVLLATAAGMAPHEAKAWGAQYERLGTQIGRELGRATGSGRGSQLGGVVGEAIGSAIGRPMDDDAQAQLARKREQEMTARLERQAQERARIKAQQDAEYEAQRRAIDPNWRPANSRLQSRAQGAVGYNVVAGYTEASGSYAGLAGQSARANQRYSDMRAAAEIGADGAVLMPRQR